MNALVVGNGSYIVQPCGHDLHGLTVINVWEAGGELQTSENSESLENFNF